MRVKLKDITKFSKGTQINGKNLIDDGAYSYLNGGINPSGKWNEFNVAENTVTISEGGNSSGYVNYMNKAFWCGAHCYYLYDGPKNSKYLYYALKSQQERLFRIRSGACMPNIKKSDLGNFILEYEQDETRQEEVVEVLEKCELLIEDYKKKLDLLDEAVRARFVEMFGDPVLNEKSWQVIKLGELCSKICSGNTPKGGSNNYKKEGIMFFRSQNVWKNRLELDDIVYIDEATHERMKETSLNYGDILITKTGRINTENSSLGRSALFLGKNDSANINGHVYLVRINSELVNRNFVLQILISPQYRDLIRRVCVGGIDKRQLNQNHIYDFPIIVPPLELQNQFASFVQEIDKSRLLNICLKSLVESVLKIRIFSEYKKSS